MKNWIMLGALALAMTSAWAQQVHVTKVAVVNPDRILRESAMAEQVSERLRREFAPREEQLAKDAKQLKKAVTEYQKKRSDMPVLERTKLEHKLAEQERVLERNERELREDLNLRRHQELQVVLMRSNEIIARIAKEDNYDLIVQEAVYANPRIDITDRVIKMLGKGK